ncbi:response regulator transcription factor [Fulvivirgaceae bacterium PWU4]|uniref:Response regulator transcription factor n=1 Tax=Chryseosolibacter histidini TaxID=2782349 RepID=A0AAP2DLD9_9BACT|nr:response regulator transcription factor [Chryseosolibacter histidini]MBT1697669.1 response regulator transcription factor [Chryseosolibacter histidini]
MSRKILIVEDEPNMGRGLKDNLEFEGYNVALAADGAAGLKMILSEHFDLILLDVMMPEMSGFDVCRKAREKGIMAPIVILTAKGEELDKVLGLELGADDYITKPFSLRELLARIKAILRRGAAMSEARETDEHRIGRLTVNFSSFTAHDLTGPIKMSHKEFAILNYLLQHKNEIISRHDLLENVWGYEESPTTRTVDNFIVKLRHKIEDDPNVPRIILTVHGTGYKLLH